MPGSYRMLSVIDPQNAVKESNESNNVANGAGFQLNWKFGTVPGHSGSTPLTLRDTDGTDVAFSLSGPGSGQVTLQGAQWNVLLTGVTNKSTFLVKTNSGGDGRVRLNDIRIAGSLDSLSASKMDLLGTLAMDGLVSSLTLGNVQGGTVAATATAPRR